jgi:hypothetical protein
MPEPSEGNNTELCEQRLANFAGCSDEKGERHAVSQWLIRDQRFGCHPPCVAPEPNQEQP